MKVKSMTKGILLPILFPHGLYLSLQQKRAQEVSEKRNYVT